MSDFDKTRLYTDIADRDELIEQLQQRNDELAATVESLTECLDRQVKDVFTVDDAIFVDNIRESTPRQDLNAVKRDSFIKGYLDAITDCGNSDENREEAEFRADRFVKGEL